MNFNQVHNNKQVLLLQCISGSKAYGLDTPQSDTDIKGVFYLPRREYYGLKYTEQVANETNDLVYYELKRFFELLLRNNPNILELLGTPEKCILYKHPLMQHIQAEMFLSKLCEQTFANYAKAQIQKAKGLNKKIFNPVEEKRKNIEHFCYVIQGYSTIPLENWLIQNNFCQHECGLVNIPHSKDLYALFHESQLTNLKCNGIYSGDTANSVLLTSIPKGIVPLALLSFNKDGYSAYCKDYSQYWDWVKRRNDTRFQNTLEHGKNYDAKNMMHTFRLLLMAKEIALNKKVNVWRADREFLLKIKQGEFSYEKLCEMAEGELEVISNLYKKSDLPDAPDENKINELLIFFREELYKM